jgi:hypothetical protein
VNLIRIAKMVAKDGIEPPTPAFLRAADHTDALRAKPERAPKLNLIQIAKMVARDGIEPPTPAFSGPRSTTELPGLSEDFQLRILCGIRLEPVEGGLPEQCPATTWLV